MKLSHHKSREKEQDNNSDIERAISKISKTKFLNSKFLSISKTLKVLHMIVNKLCQSQHMSNFHAELDLN